MAALRNRLDGLRREETARARMALGLFVVVSGAAVVLMLRARTVEEWVMASLVSLAALLLALVVFRPWLRARR
jgi:hypothetical protein